MLVIITKRVRLIIAFYRFFHHPVICIFWFMVPSIPNPQMHEEKRNKFGFICIVVINNYK